MTDQATVAIRDQVLLDTLRDHPWSTPRMLSDIILAETGGGPALWTGALWIPPWRIYPRLLKLEKEGRVERVWITSRTVLWNVKRSEAA